MAADSMPGPAPVNERPTPVPPVGPGPESFPEMSVPPQPPPPSRAEAIGVSQASGTSRHSLAASWAVVLVGLMLGMLFFWIGFYADPRAFLVLAAIVVVILFFVRRIATTRKEQREREAPPGSIGPPA